MVLSFDYFTCNGVKISKILTNGSFFVFASHRFFIPYWVAIYTKLLGQPTGELTMLLFYFSVPPLTIIGCLCIYIILKKIIPSTSWILTGSR